MLLLLAASVLHSGCRRGLRPGSDQRSFDRDAWNDEQSAALQGDGITVRQGMLQDLVTRVLPGKTREEIEQLLGASLVTPYFTETKRDLIYFLGPQRDSYRIDSEWLLIWLDAQGRVRQYRIATD